MSLNNFIKMSWCGVNRMIKHALIFESVWITDQNLSIVDRAYILINGKIFKDGTANYLAEDDDVRKLYLGENFKLDRY